MTHRGREIGRHILVGALSRSERHVCVDAIEIGIVRSSRHRCVAAKVGTLKAKLSRSSGLTGDALKPHLAGVAQKQLKESESSAAAQMTLIQ